MRDLHVVQLQLQLQLQYMTNTLYSLRDYLIIYNIRYLKLFNIIFKFQIPAKISIFSDIEANEWRGRRFFSTIFLGPRVLNLIIIVQYHRALEAAENVCRRRAN